ncbi:formate dehydrogenase accessory sulfurtransferase FdhD [Agromyces sp. Marseille-P2726]|uniref:formate dehydrogenase accessory sulfurtransferase FdhD n=1 Tax=Agromyces sp. Marseille-P2726 TaxID=2709132 RepID=UPI00156F2068|nr:formate dehydrogenase accessory sulfurtransferase FdhD [Agromyces sp. Marseille-P2726]
MSRITARRRVARYTLGERTSRREDELTVEEPLEVRVAGDPLAVTMRTPGHDVELALGLLVSEGVLRRRDDVLGARHCAGDPIDGSAEYNVVDVTLAAGVAPPATTAHHALTMTSACGICGKDSIDAVRSRSAYDVADDPVRLDPAWLAALPDRMREAQALFARTGGLHAAALVDVERDEILVVREDIGRHNAVDKVVGWALREDRLPLRGTVLVVSGRAGFELAQKASMAGIPALAAVSAASSLAVDLANEVGLTLAGFVRGASFVVYAGDERMSPADAKLEVGA